MKKIIIGTVLLAVSVTGIVINANQGDNVPFFQKTVSVFNNKEKSVNEKDVAPIIVEVIESAEVPSSEELEKDLIEKSDKEIKMAIEENNSWAEEKKFIAKANANQLDKESTKEFLKYIRLNSALHKILLERQLEELEMERL